MLKRLFLSERNIMVAILLNAALIFVMYFPQYRGNPYLELLDQLFILFFVLEAAVKLYLMKPKAYFALGWNRFDFTIVLLSLPSVLVHLLPVPNTSLLLLLRMFRLVRLIRFLRFVPNLGKIIDGLGRALKASVFVLLALLVINFFLALITCHFFSETAPDYFGDPLIASYYIFQLFTVEGWHEIAKAIELQISNPWLIGITRIYFVVIVLVGGVFGLSLANAVFVDEMTMDNNRELEKKIDDLNTQIGELKSLLQDSHSNNRPMRTNR